MRVTPATLTEGIVAVELRDASERLPLGALPRALSFFQHFDDQLLDFGIELFKRSLPAHRPVAVEPRGAGAPRSRMPNRGRGRPPEVLIRSLQQSRLMLCDESLDAPQLDRRKTQITRQCDGRQPELRRLIISVYGDVYGDVLDQGRPSQLISAHF